MESTNLFYRQANKQRYLNFAEYARKIININNIFNVKKAQLKSLFKIGYEAEFLCYRMNLLKRWVYVNELYTKYYLYGLNYIINVLCLKEELNSFEQQYLLDCNNIVFAKTRNLKNLIIDFPLITPNEKVYFKYENVDIYQFNQKTHKYRLISTNGEMYLSTKRVLIAKDLSLFPINIDTIVNYGIDNEGLTITTGGSKYLFKSNDKYLLYVSLERIFNIINYRI
jgi:hypothetical protein